jgi:hypothetical protein
MAITLSFSLIRDCLDVKSFLSDFYSLMIALGLSYFVLNLEFPNLEAANSIVSCVYVPSI